MGVSTAFRWQTKSLLQSHTEPDDSSSGGAPPWKTYQRADLGRSFAAILSRTIPSSTTAAVVGGFVHPPESEPSPPRAQHAVGDVTAMSLLGVCFGSL